MTPTLEEENRQIRLNCATARELLAATADKLRAVLKDKPLLLETPLEAQAAIESAAKSIEAALRRLKTISPVDAPAAAPERDGPTRQQGQFLAFIREYILRNRSGVAPSHAELQTILQAHASVRQLHADSARRTRVHSPHTRKSASHHLGHQP